MRPDTIQRTSVVLARIWWAAVGAAAYHLWRVFA